MITSNPALGMNMLAGPPRRLRAFTVQIEALSLKEVLARLAVYILTLSKEQDDTIYVSLPSSNLIGTTPEPISRMFKKMSDVGLIQVQTRTIDIVDMEVLNELADSGWL